MANGSLRLSQITILLLIFSPQFNRDTLSPSLRHRNIQASFLSEVPRAARFYQHLMPLYPMATTMFDLSGYDLIISSGGPATKV